MTSRYPITGDDIRTAYLEFFQERGHLLMPSASLIPTGDPTLLLTSAGMVPFKPYYTGDETPPKARLTSVQKCFRSTDIDAVGDKTHLTFFEMLGNFSIGDYFKREAIGWAWEFVTAKLGLPPERLWITVFTDDDEAYDLWLTDIGLPDDRIIRLGEADNFWGPAGDEGPCGPSSEIHYDFCPELGINGDIPGGEQERFLEIWNLVFIQFHQHPDGSRTRLPAPSIDTGMGLERTAAVMQGVTSNYDTDLLKPIVDCVANMAKTPYGQREDTDYAIRVVAEHVRSATFLIADGVIPGNEGRNYVARRIIRRSIRFARKLQIRDSFLTHVASTVIGRMASAYPELSERRDAIMSTLGQEEQQFEQALATGLALLESLMIHLRSEVRRRSESETNKIIDPRIVLDDMGPVELERISTSAQETVRNVLPSSVKHELFVSQVSGKEAFLLYDTYGFPLELTKEIALEHGLTVDEGGFEKEMSTQRQRGRSAGQFGIRQSSPGINELVNIKETPFLGHVRLNTQTIVEGILSNRGRVKHARVGDEVLVVLRETPFYPEGGGQVGDTGVIRNRTARLEIRDTQSPIRGIIVHHAVVVTGSIGVGDTVRAEVDGTHRSDVVRNHTATHLLHAALREVLGAHVRQAGSLVAPDYLRFDFTHFTTVTPGQLGEIQYRINDIVRQNIPTRKRETTYREAIEGGALAFFGDRYPDRVRVLEIGKYSYEVCGGTHVDRSGDIGAFRITEESGIGNGLRRIEAMTGRGADAWLDQRLEWLNNLSIQLRSSPQEASQRVDLLMEEAERGRQMSVTSKRDASLRQAEELLPQAETINGIVVVAARVSAPDVDSLRDMGDWIRNNLDNGVVVLGAILRERPSIVTMVTAGLVAKGYNASDIAKVAARAMDGGGGGKADTAQAGGKDPAQLQPAVDAALKFIRQKEA